MIGDLFFIIRMIVFTIVVVLFLQIRLGEYTLEERFYTQLQSSQFGQEVTEVAQGGVIAIKSGLIRLKEKFTRFWGDKTSSIDKENVPGFRHLKMGLDRSAEYVKKQAKAQLEKNTPVIKEKAQELSRDWLKDEEPQSDKESL